MTTSLLRRDGGAAGLVSVAVLALLSVAAIAAVAVGVALTQRQRLVGATDAAALAAADALSGAVAGVPCELAARVAEAGGGELSACRADGLVVEVRVEGRISGVPVAFTARAGPPPDGRPPL